MTWKIKEIKQNAVHKAMLKVFTGKHVLFLENSNSLENADRNLELWLIENKIQYNALYSVGDLPLDYIKQQIDWYDIIAFETTWTYEIAGTLKAHIASMKRKKTIVECYIHEPTWFYKPKSVVHDVYVLSSNDEDMDEWEFDKLRLNKPIWEK